MPPKTIHNAPPVSRCFKMFQDSCHIQAHPGGWVLKQHLGQLCSIESSPGKAITSAPCTSNYCSNMDSWIVRMWFWGPRRSNAQYLALLILSVVRHCVAWHWWFFSMDHLRRRTLFFSSCSYLRWRILRKISGIGWSMPLATSRVKSPSYEETLSKLISGAE